MNVRIHLDARDFQIVDRLINDHPPLLQRLIVVYDADRDLRVLNVLSAINYAAPRICSNIVGLAESQGRLRVFYGDPLTVTSAHRALSEAAYKALWPGDRWQIDLISVPMHNGKLARECLPKDSPQYATLLVAPARFQYGLIDLKDGTSRDVRS